MAKSARKLRPASDKGYDTVPQDEEERQVMAEVQAGHYVRVPPAEFKRSMASLRQAAKNAAKKVPMTMRVELVTLELIKQKAKRQGLPYQTLIASVLYKYARDDLAQGKGRK